MIGNKYIKYRLDVSLEDIKLLDLDSKILLDI